MERDTDKPKRKKRLISRRKRTIDPSTIIDYKDYEVLKRFVTDRGKIIPRRISGATAKQQRAICNAVKRARYLALIPSSISHETEKGFSGEMAAATVFAAARDVRRGGYERGGYDRPADNNFNRTDSSPVGGASTEEE